MHQQKKVVILCEYFPPSTNTAANRPFGWFTYLPENGYYPIIFCRNYVNKQLYHLTKTEKGEIHTIYWEDDFFKRKIATTKNGIVKKICVAFYLLVENALWYAPTKNMQSHIEDYLRKNKVKVIIATGSPFALFPLAAALAEKSNTPWIADYRDDWTSNEVFIKPTIAKWLQAVDTWREKRYVQSANFFTTVTAYYVQKIERVIGKKGYCIENGFMPMPQSASPATSTPKEYVQASKNLQVLYTGILYKSQDITILLNALLRCRQNGIDAIRIQFIGSEKIPAILLQPPYKELLGKYVFFKPRMPKELLDKEIEACDMLLFFSFHGKNGILKGVPGSKLYDYIFSRKPILVCEPDNDIVQEKLTQTKQGIFCTDEKQLADQLTIFAEKKRNAEKIPCIEVDKELLYQNSRQYQTKKLAELLNSL